MSIPFLNGLAIAAAAIAASQPGDIMGPFPGVQIMTGPTLVCGEAFALRLQAGEQAQYQQGHDFQVFHVDAADGSFVIYEGNHPQPHDDAIRTGRDFPSVIAIHDNRGAEARARGRIRARLVTGQEHDRLCSGRRRERP